MHNQLINTNLFFILVKDTRLDGFSNVNDFLEKTYKAYINDEELIVFPEEEYYTLFQLTYSGYT